MNTLTHLASRLLLAVSLLIITLSAAPKSLAEEQAASQAELEQMLAPIALYPDSVLSHILIAATYPVDVVQAARWSQANRDLDAAAAVAAVENKDWDPSVKALVAFPRILERMNEDLEWTQNLGEAFLRSEEDLLASVQILRERAYANGSLESLEHLKVEREAEIIVIEPAQPQVVYIPYYDTRMVYGDWHWHSHPPVYWRHPAHYTRRPGTWFYWSSGVHAPPNFFFSSFHWGRHHVVVVDIRPRHYWSSREIRRHRDAHRWQHHPRHHSLDTVYRSDRYRGDRFEVHYGRASHELRQDWRNRQQWEGNRRHSRTEWPEIRRTVPQRDLRPAGNVMRHPSMISDQRTSPRSDSRQPGHRKHPGNMRTKP